MREKWKRHRNKKKDLIRLQKLWKKRRDYERGVEEDINDVEDQMKLQERNKEVVEQLRKQQLITQTQHNEIRREYHSLETDSFDNLEQSDICFFPSVLVPSQKDVEVTGAASGAQKIMIANYIQTVQEDRDKALQLEAQFYRNAAERLKHQNRCLKNEMHSRCEVIRDFWRSNVVEGATRSGLIFREALQRK